MRVDAKVIASGPGALFAQSWTPDGVSAPEPIILLHDSLGCIELWRSFPEQLASAAKRVVIAYDRWGFGRSSARSGEMPFSFIADEAQQGFAAVLEAYQVEDFVVCGHSVGGGMAVESAGQYPDRARALITISAQAFIEDMTLSGIREAQTGFSEPGAMARLERYHGEKAGWVLSAWTDTWLNPAFRDWTLQDALASVETRTLVIHGELDEYGSMQQPGMIAGGINEAQLCQMDEVGHMPHREQPEQLAALLADFLS